MSRQFNARTLRLIRRVANAWKLERAKDSTFLHRHVLRDVQRKRHKHSKRGSWSEYLRLCRELDPGWCIRAEFSVERWKRYRRQHHIWG